MSKARQILDKAKKENTPIFVFHAKDAFALEMLKIYHRKCASNSCTTEHCNGVNDKINEFKGWGVDNADKIKKPD